MNIAVAISCWCLLDFALRTAFTSTFLTVLPFFSLIANTLLLELLQHAHTANIVFFMLYAHVRPIGKSMGPDGDTDQQRVPRTSFLIILLAQYGASIWDL